MSTQQSTIHENFVANMETVAQAYRINPASLGMVVGYEPATWYAWKRSSRRVSLTTLEDVAAKLECTSTSLVAPPEEFATALREGAVVLPPFTLTPTLVEAAGSPKRSLLNTAA